MISIIIPVFNAEKYISTCLDSIISSKLDLDIICINDGSTDRSLEILQNYGLKDKRIFIYSQENKGLACARNKGIEIAKYDYLMFIDADDYITNNALNLLNIFVHDNFYDVVLFNFSYNKITNDSYDIDIVSTDKTSILEGVLSMEISTAVCFCLISRKIFIENNIEFPSKKYYEDAFTLHRIINFSRRPCKIGNTFYFYRNTPGSLTNYINEKKIIDLFSSFDEIFVFVRTLNSGNYHYLASARFSILINIILKKINSDWFNIDLFNYFLQKTIKACKKYNIDISIIYTFIYTTYKLNRTYYNIIIDTFSHLLISKHKFTVFLIKNKNINILFNSIQLEKLDKFFFWGKNSTSELMLKTQSANNFGGYIRSDLSHLESNNTKVYKIKDLNFNENFTIIIFSIYSAHLIKQRIINLKQFNSSRHKILDFVKLLTLINDST